MTLRGGPSVMTRWLGGALFCAMVLAGCSSRSPVRTLDDGLLQVDCHGGYHDWSACHAAARRYCGDGGFRIVAQISDEGGKVGTRDWSREGSEVSRTMEFRCGQ
jgi:hypothetical protein